MYEDIQRRWRGASNPALTTSQKLQAVDPEMAKADRLQKEVRDTVKEIQAQLKDEKEQRAKTKADVKRGIMQVIKELWPD